ncbi:hypothetical protein [Microbacterium sp. 1P06AB]|uniref:glycoside hydrolase family 78 protein n=1 Tax=Microbacterium sp. 1P06AB TaxID=3132289 RepID=UPI0039A59FF0
MATRRFSGNSNYELDAYSTVSGSTITVVVRVRKLSGFGYWVADGQDYTVVIDGSTYNGEWTYDFRSTTLESVTTRSKSGMAPGSKSWSVTVKMSSGIGSASLSGSATIQPNLPSAPSIGTPARNSDSSITANWSRNASVSAPYDSQQVQRSVFTGSWSDYTTVATIGTKYTSGGSQSRADTTTVANRAYRYRIRAVNSRGSATSGITPVVYMTPGMPSAVKAAKTATGGISLIVTQTVPWASQTEIQRSIDGGATWAALATLAAGTNTYTWGSPPAGETVTFRARAVNPTGVIGSGLASGWRVSNAVPLAAPPSAPSKLDPNGVAFDGDTDRTLTWQHNSNDTSDQEAYELEWRAAGETTWNTTGKITAGSASRAFPAGSFLNGTSYEWHVRTWGIHPNAGPYSATATFTASAPPSVTITALAGVLGASLVNAEWEYFDEESTAQSAWEAVLMAAGDDIESLSGSGPSTSATFTTRLTDATEYQVRVRVRDGASLWSEWDTVTFSTDFPPPPKPSISLSWDAEQGAVIAEVTNPEPAGSEVPAVSNDLYWSINGGEWRLAVTGAMLNTATADRTAPVGVTIAYKAVAWSDLPSSVESDVATIMTPNEIGYWSASDGQTVPMEYGNGDGPRVDFTAGMAEKTLHYFAGRSLPIEVVGTARSRVGSVTFMVATRDQLNSIRAMQYLPAPHLIRIPDGTLLFCSVGEVSERRVHDDLYGISFTATEVSQ